MAGIKDVDKIQRELVKVQREIKSTLQKYKTSDGDKKARYIEDLKDLQSRRKELDAKLEDIIGSLHQSAELETED
tara:strand:- start:148 stop:372 length:225 start_codon:yes stop_codon:yes gene_type:complete